MQSLTEQQNSRAALAKHEAFSMIANSFKSYFDPRRQMDDDYVQSILNEAASELDKLRKENVEVRKIMGIGESDSVQDAVAKLLLSAYHP